MGKAAGGQVVSGRDAEAFAVFPHKMILADKKDAGKLIERDFFHVMRKKIFAYLLQLILRSMRVRRAAFAFGKAEDAQIGQIFMRQKLLVRIAVCLKTEKRGKAFVKKPGIAGREYERRTLRKKLRIKLCRTSAVEMHPFQFPQRRGTAFIGIGERAVDPSAVSLTQLPCPAAVNKLPASNRYDKKEKRFKLAAAADVRLCMSQETDFLQIQIMLLCIRRRCYERLLGKRILHFKPLCMM